jgi:hypothetical protein
MCVLMAITVVVLGALGALAMWIHHLEADYHNTELDELLKRMDASQINSEAVTAEISKLKAAMGFTKQR